MIYKNILLEQITCKKEKVKDIDLVIEYVDNKDLAL